MGIKSIIVFAILAAISVSTKKFLKNKNINPSGDAIKSNKYRPPVIIYIPQEKEGSLALEVFTYPSEEEVGKLKQKGISDQDIVALYKKSGNAYSYAEYVDKLKMQGRSDEDIENMVYH